MTQMMVTASGTGSLAFSSSVLFRNMRHWQLCACWMEPHQGCRHQDIPLALLITSLPGWKNPCQEVLFKACTQYWTWITSRTITLFTVTGAREVSRQRLKSLLYSCCVADDNCKMFERKKCQRYLFKPISGFHLSTAKYKTPKQLEKEEPRPGVFVWMPQTLAVMQHVCPPLCCVVQLMPREW